MQKIIYLLITYPVCVILGVGHLWLWFAIVYSAMHLMKLPSSIWWEIPLAVLFCGVIELAFRDEISFVLRLCVLLGSMLTAYENPRKLLLFFLFALTAVFYDGIYAFAAAWALLWCSARDILIQWSQPVKEYSITE